MSGLLIGAGAAMFLCALWVDSRWRADAPRSADPIKGLIYPHNEHGLITYFTAFQATSTALLFATFLAVFMLGWGFAPKKNFRDQPGRWGMSVRFDIDGSKRALIIAQCFGAICGVAIIRALGPTIVTILIAHGVVLNLG